MDRRRDTRQGKDEDWESIALARVSAHVEAVTAASSRAAVTPEGADGDDDHDDYGWEESVLRALRKRLFKDPV
jgi:hypothetical protein